MGIASQVRPFVGCFISGKGIEFCEDGDLLRSDSRRLRDPWAIEGVAGGLDYIACVHFLEHFDNPVEHLRKWFSKVRSGGTMLIVLPHKNLYPAEGDPGNPDHKWKADAKDLVAMMEETGEKFRIVHQGVDERSLSFFVVFEKPGKMHQKQISVEYVSKRDVNYSIVIPYKDKLDLTVDCLRSIQNSKWTPREIILVDDGSKEKLDLSEYIDLSGIAPYVRIIRNEKNLGFPKSVNIGVAELSEDCRVVVLLNNDTIVHDGGDKKLIAPLFDTSIAISGQQGGRLGENFEYVGDGEDYVEFYCAAIKRVVWDELGGLDEGFGLGYGEDSDFCIRARKAGYKLSVVGSGVCDHLRNQTFKPSVETKRLIERNRMRIIEKHHKGNVLFCVASTGVSGGIKVIWNCAKALRDAGYRTDALLCFDTHEWPTVDTKWCEFDRLLTLGNMRRNERKYDFVVSTFYMTWDIAATIPAKKHHIGLVQSDEPRWFANTHPPYHPEHAKSFGLPGFKSVIVADHMWELADKYGMDIVGKIDNGVDSRVFCQRQTFEREWPHSIMAIRKGNHVWFDGQEDIDKAAEILACRYSDFSYLIVGHSSNKKSWNAPKCSYSWIETYDEKKMCSLYNSVSVYVIPSIIEGSSLTALEAMACGTPVVCTEIVSDAAIDGETALIVPYSDPQAIADAVSRIFDDEKLRSKLYHGGLKMAMQRTHERQREQFLQIIESLS